MGSQLKVAVIGGGIGGLFAANALVAQGLVVQRDLLRALVELPNGDDAESVARMYATHDIVRDVAVPALTFARSLPPTVDPT